MEPTPDHVDNSKKVKPLYWIAAAALAIAIAIDLSKPPVNWFSFAGRVPLLAVLVMLATAKPVETHAKKIVMYVLIALSIGLFIAKVVLSR